MRVIATWMDHIFEHSNVTETLKLVLENLVMMFRYWVQSTIEQCSILLQFQVNVLVGETSQFATKKLGKQTN
jgi:hypothetical protein